MNTSLLRGYGWKNFKKQALWRQDKGHANEVRVFLDAVAKGTTPISMEEIEEVTRISIELSGNLR